MPTDEERREVARRLRDDAERGALPYSDFLGAVAYDVDVEKENAAVLNRLADLIEPSGDRDALLALADEMERMPQCELCPAKIVDCSAHPDGCPDALLDHYACRIREALGVEDYASHDD